MAKYATVITVNGTQYQVTDRLSAILSNNEGFDNLFEDGSGVLRNAYVNAAGETVQANGIFQTDYIPVIHGERYSDSTNNGGVYWFDNTLNFISITESLIFVRQGYVQAPDGACFAKFISSLDGIDSYFVYNLNSGIPAISNRFRKDRATIGTYIDQYGNTQTSASIFQTDYIIVKPTKKYCATQINGFVLWFNVGLELIGSTNSTDFLAAGYVTAPQGAYFAKFIGNTKYINIFRVWEKIESGSSGGSSSIESYNVGQLNEKRWTALGDSITYRNQWQPKIAELLGLIYTNCGIGSTRLSGTDANAFWRASRLNAVKNSNPDILTILGGANDITLSNPQIGTKEELGFDIPSNVDTSANAAVYNSSTSYSTGNYSLHDGLLYECTAPTTGSFDPSKWKPVKNVNTFIGAYSYIIETMLAWKPKLSIVILGTTWAHDDGATFSLELSYTDFSEACRTVAAYYGLPFVDLHGEAGFNKFTLGSGSYAVYSDDHIHPNQLGADRITKLVLDAFVNKLTVSAT